MSNSPNILVTGADGQLGMELRAVSDHDPSLNFFFTTRAELDITNRDAIEKYFSVNRFDYCINCAAYTAVDQAEKDTESAILVNATAVANLAAACKEHLVKLFHFSTDYVFDGTANTSYRETDEVSPVNAYGKSKLLGEKKALENNPDTIIIRTSWVYSRYGKNFVKTMIRLMKEKSSIQVVHDQKGCPTYAADLAHAVVDIVSKNNFIPGIYHFCNQGIISWYEFASAIKMFTNSSCEVKPIPTAEFPTPAKRPAYSALDSAKFRATFSIEIPFWRDSLKKCIGLLEG